MTAGHTAGDPFGKRFPPRIEGFAFLALGAATLAFRIGHFPTHFGEVFGQLWSLGVWAIPIFYLAGKPRPVRHRALLLFPVAIAVQIAQMFFHIQGLSFLLFAIIWTVGWRTQQAKRGGSPMLGNVAGALFSLAGLWISLNHIAGVIRLRRITDVDVAKIERIELFRPRDSLRREITARGEIDAIGLALRETYPYSPNHEGIQDHEPWAMRLVLTTPATPITFLVGNGMSDDHHAAWVALSRGESYINVALYDVLTRRIEAPLW